MGIAVDALGDFARKLCGGGRGLIDDAAVIAVDARQNTHIRLYKVGAVRVCKPDLVFHAASADRSVLAALDGGHELKEAALILFLGGIEEGKAGIGALEAAVDVGVALGTVIFGIDIGLRESGVCLGIVDVLFHDFSPKKEADTLRKRIRLPINRSNNARSEYP